jgi:hypothetical protein
MSLVPMLVDVSRDAFAADVYGGEIGTPGAVYSGLTATFNYIPRRNRTERFEKAGEGRAGGLGVQTRTLGVVIFDPKPSGVTIIVNDKIVANPTVAGVPSVLHVIGVRTYEVTLQLDVEQIG